MASGVMRVASELVASRSEPREQSTFSASARRLQTVLDMNCGLPRATQPSHKVVSRPTLASRIAVTAIDINRSVRRAPANAGSRPGAVSLCPLCSCRLHSATTSLACRTKKLIYGLLLRATFISQVLLLPPHRWQRQLEPP